MDNNISTALLEKIKHFIETVPPERLSRNLRNLLLEHLLVQKDGYTFDMDDLLLDMMGLFELLEAIETEGKQ